MNQDTPETPTNETPDDNSSVEDGSGDAGVPSQEAIPETPSDSVDGNDAGLEQAVAQAQLRIGKLTAEIHKNTTITLCIGGILLLVLGGYFYYGYGQVAQLFDPNVAVPRLEMLIEDQGIPEIRNRVNKLVDQNAQDVAAQLNQSAIDGMPTIREQLEEHAVTQLDEIVSQTSPMSEKRFREILKKHHPKLQKAFKELDDADEEVSAKTVNDLLAILEQELQTDFEDDVQVLLATLFHVNAKVKRLLANRGLNAEDNLTRQMILTYRRIALNYGEPALTNRDINTASPDSGREKDDAKKDDAKKGDAKKGDAKKGDAKKGNAKKGDAKKKGS